MSKTPFANICIFMIFIISGLKLNTSSIKQALKYWPVRLVYPIHLQYFLLGLFFILFLTPFAGYIVLKIPIKTKELTVGTAIMCCCPTVLASAAILADQVQFTILCDSSAVVILRQLFFSQFLAICQVYLQVPLQLPFYLQAAVWKSTLIFSAY